LNKDSDTFSFDSAEPHLASYQISHQEVTQLISQIEAEYKLQKQSKMKDERDVMSLWLSNIILVVLGSLIFSSFLPDSDGQYDQVSKRGFFAALSVPFYLCKVWMWLVPSWKGPTYSFDQMRGKCQEIVDQHNKILRSRGLKWSCPSQFPDWIELTKDLQKPNNEFEQISQISEIPPMTETTIIFPVQFFVFPLKYRNLQSQQTKPTRDYIFSADFYSSEMTDDRLSHEEVQDFISEMNVGYRKILKSSTDQAEEKIYPPLFYLIGSFFLFMVCVHPSILKKFEYLIIGFMVVGLIFFFVKECRETDKKNIQIRAECQTIVDKYNQNLRHRGLRWSLPEKFPLWIELCKDYSSRIQLIDIPSNAEDLEAQRPKYDRNYYKKPQNDMYARLLDDDN